MPGLDEKGPNLFSGRPSTPPPAKKLTTVWPSSHNPYYPKRTERPPPPSEERVERPEQKLRGGESTGEACILSPGPPCSFPFFSLIISRLPFQAPPFIRVLASFDLDHSSAFAALTRFLKYDLSNIMRYSAPCTPCTQAENRKNRKSYCASRDKPSVERRTKFITVGNKRGRVIVILIIYIRVKGLRENYSYDGEIYLCP